MSDFITNGELRIEAERLCDENERLESENAKFHKLILANMEDDMRELGIEVDG